MGPTNNPQAPLVGQQQPVAQPSLWDTLRNFLMGAGPLKAAAQGSAPLAPAPQPVPQSGGQNYLQDAVKQYMQEQGKKMPTTPDKILAAPAKKRGKNTSYNPPISTFEGAEKA